MSADVPKFLSRLLPSILRTAGAVLPGSLSAAVNEVAKGIEGATPEEKAKLEAAFAAHEEELARIALEGRKVDAAVIAELEATARADAASADKYTQRARPTGLYIGYACTVVLMATQSVLAIMGKPLIPSTELLAMLAPLWGSASWYFQKRTEEKKAGV